MEKRVKERGIYVYTYIGDVSEREMGIL